MASPSPAQIESLLQGTRGVWRGGWLARVAARATGFDLLDRQLPGGGWPVGALTEIVPACEGLGELSLTLPALRALCAEGRIVALVNPPHIPYAPALVRAGLPLQSVLWIEAARDEEARWAAEQLLRDGAAAVLLWSTGRDDRSLRRLQLAAEAGGACGFLYRCPTVLKDPSPAALRLALYPHESGVRTDLVKVRGGHSAQVVLALTWPSV